jgi:hypothetical protein
MNENITKVNRTALSRARVNIKSLAAEAAIIRSEKRRIKDIWVKNDLHNHRMEKIRPEARLANLAIAYIKGRKIENVEVTPSKKKIDIKRLKSKLSSFYMDTSWPPNIPTEDDIRKWVGSR